MSHLYTDDGQPNIDQILARFPRDFIDDLPLDRAAAMAESLGLRLWQVIRYFEEEGAR